MIGWVSLRASVASSVRLSSTSRLSPPSCACTNFLVFLCSISRASAMASFEEEDDDAQFRAEMCRRGRSDEEEMERRRAARASAMVDDDDDDTRFDEETERRRAWANALARAQASISGDDDATLRGDQRAADATVDGELAVHRTNTHRDKREADATADGELAVHRTNAHRDKREAARAHASVANDDDATMRGGQSAADAKADGELAVHRTNTHRDKREADAAAEREANAHLEKRRAAAAVRHEQEGHEVILSKVRVAAQAAVQEAMEELDVSQHRSAVLAAKFIALQSEGTHTEHSTALFFDLVREATNDPNMTGVDISVLKHLLVHITHPGAKYSEFISDFSLHFSNVLGMQEYLNLANILRLPKETWIKGQRKILRELVHIRWMFRQMDIWSASHDDELWTVISDATRITACASAVVIPPDTNFLIGGSFPPNPIYHPRLKQLAKIKTGFSELKEDIDCLVEAGTLAVNVMLYGMLCATDPWRELTITNCYPCARSKNTLIHQVLEWSFCIYWSCHYEDDTPRPREYQPRLVGAATDSCGVELGGAKYWMTPNAEEISKG